MPAFTFALDSFNITDTRSRHKDTDFVTLSLVINPQGNPGTPQSKTKSMGDLNNGTFPVNLQFANVTVNPGDTGTLNYLIMNSGHSKPGEIVQTLENAAASALMKGADLLSEWLTSAGIPDTKGALEKIAKYIADEIDSIIDANCDGLVAAAQFAFTYDELFSMTRFGTHRQGDRHPGTDSPHGCGGNSMYGVNWHMTNDDARADRRVPGLVGKTMPQAENLLTAVQLVPNLTGLLPAQRNANSWVFSQSVPEGALLLAGSGVTLVLHNGPRL